jgi:hypothetical protein
LLVGAQRFLYCPDDVPAKLQWQYNYLAVQVHFALAPLGLRCVEPQGEGDYRDQAITGSIENTSRESGGAESRHLRFLAPPEPVFVR